MPWSGRAALVDRWLPRFVNTQLCQTEADKYIATARVPDDGRADKWMARALDRDTALAEISDPENLAVGPSRFQLSDCSHCHGNRYVRVNVGVDDSRFGKALSCPACNGGRPGDVIAPASDIPSPRPGNWCYKCGANEADPALERCTNPTWHWPNVNDVRGPLVKRF